jgi:predicted alpha/beta-fold hydrolase
VPLVSESSYRSPLFFSNPHVQTVFPSVFRKVPGVAYVRERVNTPDDDFVDVDLSLIGAKRVAIVLHGLEGNSERSYVLGIVKALNKGGWDAAALNFRGCSGEPNRQLRFYHSGDTGDLRTVAAHLEATRGYGTMALVGFSLGGNVVLKYLGELGEEAQSRIHGAVAMSVPCDLTSGSQELDKRSNTLYMKRFLKMLREKIRMKMLVKPGAINDDGYEQIKNFKDFDDRYTAPLFGFQNAYDYWEKASSKPFLPSIAVPTLLINAADDPFLAPPCYPNEEALANPNLFMEVPPHGGHVGFVTFNAGGEYWSERRTVEFLNSRETFL